jgi:hypothetical protein
MSVEEMMMLLKPLKAQQLLRLMLENVRRFRAGQMTYGHFFLRAQNFWRYALRMGFEPAVDAAYLTALGYAK